MSVRRCRREVSAREFYDWQLYQRIEPLAADRTEFMLAQLTAHVVSALDGQAHKPGEFMPKRATDEENVDTDAIFQNARASVMAHPNLSLQPANGD